MTRKVVVLLPILIGCNAEVTTTATTTNTTNNTTVVTTTKEEVKQTPQASTTQTTPAKTKFAEFLFNGALDGSSASYYSFSQGCHGSSIELGSTSYVTVPSTASNSPTSALSISLSIYPTQTVTNGDLIAKHTDDGNQGYLIWVTAESGVTKVRAVFQYSNTESAQIQSSWTVPLNQWTQIAVTYDGSQMLLYKNGTVTDSVTQTSRIYATSEPLTFGRHSHADKYHFIGKLDDVRLYDYAISAEDVSKLHTVCD